MRQGLRRFRARKRSLTLEALSNRINWASLLDGSKAIT